MHGTARVEGMGLINCWVVACVACLPLPVQLLSLTVVCWHVFAFIHTACMHVHTNVFMLHIDAYMYAHVHMYMYVCTCVGQLASRALNNSLSSDQKQGSHQMLSNGVVQIQSSKEKFINYSYINYAFLRPLQRKMENYRAVLHHSKQACLARTLQKCLVHIEVHFTHTYVQGCYTYTYVSTPTTPHASTYLARMTAATVSVPRKLRR